MLPPLPGVKRIDEFYSMWSSRTVPSPWPPASGEAQAPPACLTILLHHDNMKVPETLARVAIRTGMVREGGWEWSPGFLGPLDVHSSNRPCWFVSLVVSAFDG